MTASTARLLGAGKTWLTLAMVLYIRAVQQIEEAKQIALAIEELEAVRENNITMARRRRRRAKKSRGKIKLKPTATIAPKDSVKTDTLPRMQARPPADVGPVFRVKIRRKNG